MIRNSYNAVELQHMGIHFNFATIPECGKAVNAFQIGVQSLRDAVIFAQRQFADS